MEQEILKELKRIYKYIEINVEYNDIRQYLIIVKINKCETKFIYIYDAKLTFNANISTIEQEIDKIIIKYYTGVDINV